MFKKSDTKNILTTAIIAGAFTLGSLGLAGCGEMAPQTPGTDIPAIDADATDMQNNDAATDGSTGDASDSGNTEGSGGSEMPEQGDAQEGCFVHLYDGDNFDENDSNFKLTTPGKYESLSNLPGADKDWSDEADSLKVGPKATVTIWSEPNFQGNEMTFQQGTDQPDLDDEPQSLELVCGS